MPDFSPAPGSIATSAPRPTSFLTVSGVAATRDSEGSDSAPIAIFMLSPAADLSGRVMRPQRCSDQEKGHQSDDDDDRAAAPLHQGDEVPVGLLVRGIVITLCDRIFHSIVRGHHAVLSKSKRSQAGEFKNGAHSRAARRGPERLTEEFRI